MLTLYDAGDPEEKNYSENCQLLQQLIEATCGDGVVYFPDDFKSSKVCGVEWNFECRGLAVI